uniref:Palmitoyltransferase n=1 Tax=Pelusios castaneus TaxID=367368 RepID=A0A8C8RC87_9SAUR
MYAGLRDPSVLECTKKTMEGTGPEQLNSRQDLVSAPQHSRVNGWSLPLHTFQFVGLLFYTYLAIVGFGIYIPLLPHGWKYAAYAVSFFLNPPVIGVLFVHHLVAHLVAITIDPADQNVLAKKNYSSPMPVFDRSRHKHVIQNQHCYLCEVDVGPKAKHCSACNKCIADFDHHCKWLNNCVGGRNYWFFFNAVASAVLGVFLLILVILYVFIQYFVNPAELRTAPQSSIGPNLNFVSRCIRNTLKYVIFKKIFISIFLPFITWEMEISVHTKLFLIVFHVVVHFRRFRDMYDLTMSLETNVVSKCCKAFPYNSSSYTLICNTFLPFHF